MGLTIAEIAERIQGEVVGDQLTVVKGFAAAHAAQAGDLTFAENETFLKLAEASEATAILVEKSIVSSVKPLIRVKNARVAFAQVLPLFFPEKVFVAGIHPTAVVAPTAKVAASAHIGPYCVIGEEVQIGERVVLEGSAHVSDKVVIGADSHIFPHVTLYSRSLIGQRVRIHAGAVIGSDGYGYVFDQGKHRKIPQIGQVIIHDDVEIGANVTIDRGALGPTVIGAGTKIDNLVQLGHNVVIGEHCLLVSQVGIAGSTQVGSYVTLAGQVGLAGHLKIGNQVTIAAKAGVMSDIPDGEKWLGIPAGPDRQAKRQMIAVRQLPDLIHRVRQLEKRLEQSAPDGAKV
jgi:UDP-3-O-[3-hydroxymyristoyl] glucosamine N-acyltransferase